jgi:hypothetical protein
MWSLARGGSVEVKFTLVEDQGSPRKKRRKRQQVYGKGVLAPLQRVWVICDGICGKRLAVTHRGGAVSAGKAHVDWGNVGGCKRQRRPSTVWQR